MTQMHLVGSGPMRIANGGPARRPRSRRVQQLRTDGNGARATARPHPPATRRAQRVAPHAPHRARADRPCPAGDHKQRASIGAEKWHTVTTYGGDYTASTPATGDTATARYVDARGQTTELRQFRGGTPAGGYERTQYGYTSGGKLNLTVDPAGNRWTTKYD